MNLLKQLADYVIEYHFPEINSLPVEDKYSTFLGKVVESTAKLCSYWQAVGFVHGVLNTDNMSILGVTIDYGPFGFMDTYDVDYTPNHSDEENRYSYAKQPQICFWNLQKLSEALSPLISEPIKIQQALDKYWPYYKRSYNKLMFEKLGLSNIPTEGSSLKADENLVSELLSLMYSAKSDFTITFRQLSCIKKNADINILTDEENELVNSFGILNTKFKEWMQTYKTRLLQENLTDDQRKINMNKVNPKYILRNYLAQNAIKMAEGDDFSEVKTLFELLKNPYAEQDSSMLKYAQKPPPSACKIQLSCSS